ncbi:transformer-2 protein homolog alpha-like isoform X3 [Lethenteron reissneri]|uniref:transformer-2 protein homolog alpha-like isoform X3 n=1 Tax=Lethenteron reissneri TaxID=7753 RepID=UPI002AB68BAB|nr:transformer-2 protein homolog alpha-like isoform X3 [Lethenteron reissneri]
MSDAEDGITFETRNSLLKSKSRSPATRRSKSASRSKSRSRSRSKSSRSRSRSRHSSYRRYSRSRSRSRSRRRHRSRSHSRRRRSFTNSPFSNRRRHQGDRCAYNARQGNPEPNTCLGVFGLSLYTTEHDLREVFGRYGPVADVNVVYDQQSGRPRGFAFVYMQNMEDSKEAKERVNGMELDGRNIRVDFSITKRAHTPTPGIYMGRPSFPPRRREGHERGGYDRGDRYDRGERGGGGGGGGYHSRGGYDRGGYDRYEERDYDHRHSHSSYGRKRSPSPYYGRGGGYHSRSRSRSYSPRRY